MEDGRSTQQPEQSIEQAEWVVEASASSSPWGTLEDAFLGGAICRHNTDWNKVADELHLRANLLSWPASSYSTQACKSRYEALNERYASHRNGNVGRTNEPECFPPWLGEVTKRRIAFIQREVERHDVNILQLSKKLAGEKSLSANKQQQAQHVQENCQASADVVPTVAEISSLRQEVREAKAADVPVAIVPALHSDATAPSNERVDPGTADADATVIEQRLAERETEKAASTSQDGNDAFSNKVVMEPERPVETAEAGVEHFTDTAKGSEDVKLVEAPGEVVDTNAPEALDAEKVVSRNVDTGKRTEVVVNAVENEASSQQAEAERPRPKDVSMVCLKNEAVDARSEDAKSERSEDAEAATCKHEKLEKGGAAGEGLDSCREKGDRAEQAAETRTDMEIENDRSAPLAETGTAVVQESKAVAESVSNVVEKAEAVPEQEQAVTTETRSSSANKEEPSAEPSPGLAGKHGIVGEQSMAEPSRPVSSERTDREEKAQVAEKKDTDEDCEGAKRRDPVVVVAKKRDKDEKVQYTKRRVRDEKLKKKDADDAHEVAEKTDDKLHAPELKEKIDESQGGAPVAEKVEKPNANTQQDAGSPASQNNEGEQSKDSHVSSQADGPEDTCRSSKKDIKLSEKQQPLLEILKAISNHKLASFFKQKAQDPRYDRGIRRHVDLNMVKARLEEGAYSSSLEFYRDVLLVFTNVIVFYPRDSEEHCAALALKKLAVEEIEKVLQTEAGIEKPPPASSRKREKKSSSDTPSAPPQPQPQPQPQPPPPPPPPPPPSRSKVRQAGVAGLEVSTSDNSKSKSASVSMTAVPSSKGGEEDDTREGEPEVEGKSKPLKAYGRKNRAATTAVSAGQKESAPAKPVIKEKPLESFAKKSSKEERPASPPPLPPAKEKKERKDKESGKASANQETSSSKKAKATPANVTASTAGRGARNKRTAKDSNQRSSKRSRRS